MAKRDLCSKCHGNGVLRLPNGLEECSRCDGYGLEPNSLQITKLIKRAEAAEARAARLQAALTGALQEGRLLLQNSEGCAVNHYGHDIELHGLPGWLKTACDRLEEYARVLADTAPDANDGRAG